MGGTCLRCETNALSSAVHTDDRCPSVLIPVERRPWLCAGYGAATCYFVAGVIGLFPGALHPPAYDAWLISGLETAAYLVFTVFCAAKLVWMASGHEYVYLLGNGLVAGWRAGPLGRRLRMTRPEVREVRVEAVTGLERKVAYRKWTLGIIAQGDAGLKIRGSRSAVLLGVGLSRDQLEHLRCTVQTWLSEYDAEGAPPGM